MVGLITQSSNFNSFSSIVYCVVTLGIQVYASYRAISRYKEADGRVWPGLGGDAPVEVSSLLGLTILSLLLMPLFCLACLLKVGNMANDGVKLGRDQEKAKAENNNKGQQGGGSGGSGGSGGGDVPKKAEETAKDKLRRKAWYLWQHFCPIAQTIHLMAAFLLLLPEVLLTAVEVKFGYKSPDVPWESELDFLFPEDRAMKSFLRSSANLTQEPNATHYQLPGQPSHTPGGWGDRVSISIAFVHFCMALTCFLVRYASVFWYTNKALTLVFGAQLVAMVLSCIFGFNGFATLYCLAYNQRLYPNVRLSLGAQTDLALYVIGSAILVVSSVTVFEYGSHYFHEKSKIVERHHETDSYMKQTVIINSGCQGYVPHSIAMAALVFFAICKGPIVYDLVSLMRQTNDQLMMSGVVCEVCYMVMWVALWFCLTIKQKWQFRLLDYVPLRHLSSLSMTLDGSCVKIPRSDRGDSVDSGSLTRIKRSSLTTSNPQIRYTDSSANGNNSPFEDQCQSDLGTDESDMIDNAAVEVILGPDARPMDGNSSLRRSRARRTAGQRVTFNERIDHSRQFSEPAYHGSLPRSSSHNQAMSASAQDVHMNVTADIHNDTPPPLPPIEADVESSQVSVIARRNSGTHDVALPKEYRNSIRNKCGEFYNSSNNLSSSQEDVRSPGINNIPADPPLTTLMSSFRDKVRESSIAASNFKERERHMLENYNNYDEAPMLPANLPADQQQLPSDADKRVVDRDGHVMDNASSSLTRRKPLATSSNGSEDSARNSLTNSTMESSDLSLPPLMEDIQLGRVRRLSGGGGGGGPREDFNDLTGGKTDHHHHPAYHNHQQHPQHHHHHHHNIQLQNHTHHLQPHTRPVKVLMGRKAEMGRRDSANYSLTSSSQDNSSNESDHGGQALCSQNDATTNTPQR